MQKVINNVLEWHKKQFPDVTKDDVISKLRIEGLELHDALKENDLEHIIEEIADVCIVSISLTRFVEIDIIKNKFWSSYDLKSVLASLLYETVVDKQLKRSIVDFFKAAHHYCSESGLNMSEEIEKKMVINKSRDWSKRS